MARNTLDDVRDFLETLATDLTNLHVAATQLQTTPEDRAPADTIIAIPSRLLGEAQALSARLEPHDAAPRGAAGTGEESEPKPVRRAR